MSCSMWFPMRLEQSLLEVRLKEVIAGVEPTDRAWNIRLGTGIQGSLNMLQSINFIGEDEHILKDCFR